MRCLGYYAVVAFLSLSISTSLCAQDSDSGKLRTSIPSPPPPGKADDSSYVPPPVSIAPNAPHIARQTRYEIIRDFETQLVYSRTLFPMGTKGLILHNGVIAPNGEELQQSLNLWGPSIKPGDPADISYVQIKSDHIHFEINGGPVHRQKWYEHIQVAGANGPAMGGPNSAQTNPHGSSVDLSFDKYVPELTAARRAAHPAGRLRFVWRYGRAAFRFGEGGAGC